MPPMASTGLQIRLPSYAHNAIAYSPFDPDRLAVASGTNFGLSGKGAIHVLRKVDGPQGKGLRVEKRRVRSLERSSTGNARLKTSCFHTALRLQIALSILHGRRIIPIMCSSHVEMVAVSCMMRL